MTGKVDIIIREARVNDAREISDLTIRLLHTFLQPDLTEEGENILLETLRPEAVRERIESGQYSTYLALEGNKVVGIISMKEVTHLYHLFVSESHQGRGIAKKLWETALRECLSDRQIKEITVNASGYAVGFYQKIGFSPTGPAEWKNGIRSTPMVWKAPG